MNDLPVTGKFRKATEQYYLMVYSQLKPGKLACEYKMPFKNYFTVY